ncbi:MAG: acetate--CoA ligase [Marine Group III euryarchaeote CG-Epi1]|uniref:Acetyl-coenzyme A synthetase n=1 Tax=Marine Group III euryarchaeote CG-Epi1 TaxID=1888995 RepID=A0A1J5T889_9ARCH|nr:MAG: acetate--CoA ligase [Marine Group III euryarchaeote CG-Epi1]|tara:strand:- start:237 stop:2168 length:1932 start_codon:yes stop_codon:yes gene_type:complete
MKSFKPNEKIKNNAYVGSVEKYNEIYDYSIKDPEGFWAEQAERITWFKKWNKVWNWDFNKADISWYEGAELNACYNCVDRHVDNGHGNETALIWEGNDSSESKKLSYNDLLTEVQLAANSLKGLGVEKGDRVCIYMQMIPELTIALLACARIGAVHSVVFGAFSPDSLESRINDSECKVLVTQDTGVRGTKNDIPMKANADKAVKNTPSIEKILVVKRTGSPIEMEPSRDVWWHEAIASADSNCEPEIMNAEDPLFILYTSGSTGKPKGVMHTTGGYMVYTSTTYHYIFDYKPGEIYWCTADIGWITGHSYIVYGPMANRAVTVMFEGVPNYPDYGRFWEIVEKHKVNIFYTAPTALRALMKEGDDWPKRYNLESLRLLGTVGEPIKEPEWMWYHSIIGNEKCPIVDTWWQTETGGIMITPLPGVTETKPGSATRPFFGVLPELVDDDGNVLEGNNVEGNLVMQRPWPSIMRTVYGDHKRFFDTYFSRFPGKYFSGDGCKRDENGYYWITGRVDDVIIVSGHNLGTAEIEGSIGGHADVAEAAVVGYPHDIKGNSIYAFVTLRTGREITENTRTEIAKIVRADIGPHATPEKIQFTEGLPKTRSGKIMRRILRNIASDNIDDLGDISTLADPSVVESLVNNRI